MSDYDELLQKTKDTARELFGDPSEEDPSGAASIAFYLWK